MNVYVLTETSHSDNKTEVVDVYEKFEDARADMETRFISSKKFWDELPDFEKKNCELYIELYNTYAEAYRIDSDYEQMGMSWNIETFKVIPASTEPIKEA